MLDCCVDDKEVLECGLEDMGELEVLDESRGEELTVGKHREEIVGKTKVGAPEFCANEVLVQSCERYEKKKNTDTRR